MEKKKTMADLAEVLLKVSNEIRSLADAVQALCPDMAGDLTIKESEAPPEPEIPLEKVRGILAEKSRDGYTAEVRAIIKKFGADRLSDIDPKDYAAVLKEAEVL